MITCFEYHYIRNQIKAILMVIKLNETLSTETLHGVIITNKTDKVLEVESEAE